jgi:PAS domain-containing protein
MELSLSSSEFDAIERTAAHLKLATDSAEIGTWSLNIKTQKLEWSALHKRIWGYDEHRTDLVYEDWHKIILPADKETAFEKVEEARVKQTIYDVEYRINRANNSALRYIRSVGKYHYNDKGEAETLTGISIDVTEEKIAQEELTRAYEQIRLSKEAAELGMFDMDLIIGDLIWDERCRQLFGISHKNAVTYENDFVRGLHPEDRAWVIKLIDDLFTLHDSNGDYDVEYRTVGVDDKKIRWVRAKGKVFYDSGHTPVRFIGSVLDISTNKNYQQELQIINEELAGSNDELRIANVQLNNLQKALQQSNINLIASNEKLGHALTTGMMGNWSINPADMSILCKNLTGLAC